MKKNKKIRSGDVVCADRGLYKHYGVYDHGNVIEMSFGKGDKSLKRKNNAYVHKVSMKDFSNGDPCYVDNSSERYSHKKTLKRAKREIGSGRGTYDIVYNNCEHKAREWETGRKQSEQVKGFGGIAAGIFKLIP